MILLASGVSSPFKAGPAPSAGPDLFVRPLSPLDSAAPLVARVAPILAARPSEPFATDVDVAVAEDSSSGLRFLLTSEEMSLTAPAGMEEEEDDNEEEEETDGSLLRFLRTAIILTPEGADDDAEEADPKVIFLSPLLLPPTSSSARGNGAVNPDVRVVEEEEEEEDGAPRNEEDEPTPFSPEGPAPLEVPTPGAEPCCFFAGLR